MVAEPEASGFASSDSRKNQAHEVTGAHVTHEQRIEQASAKWNYPEMADSFSLRHRNLLYCSSLVVIRTEVA
jgi:hypothetical protein